MLDMERIAKISRAKDAIVESFDAGDWMLLESYLGDAGSVISAHPRLLRSLNFGDEDYPSCVAQVLSQLIKCEPEALTLVYTILEKKGNSNTSENLGGGIPSLNGHDAARVDTSLATAMMPFDDSFAYVRKAMNDACRNVGLELKAADDVWNDTTIIKDIFDLITRACIVIVDFTGKNPNVMYETGAAHAWGKEVIPVSQSLDDLPFDLRHHRVLLYENNGAGLVVLRKELEKRMRTILQKHGWNVLPF